MITVKILADSINSKGIRLTTWDLAYPRIIHAEFMTHRLFSRNAASSRATPYQKKLLEVMNDPALPEYFGRSQKGMEAGEQIKGQEENDLRNQLHWLGAMVGKTVDIMAEKYDLHKSIPNRYFEPWSHIRVIATATNHDNFFALRANSQAEPTFQVLAYRMLQQYLDHAPDLVEDEGWHLPTITELERETFQMSDLLKIATARIARVSYNNFDKPTTVNDDILLHDKLASSRHWSPFEHCAQSINSEMRGIFFGQKVYPYSNFDSLPRQSGWAQYRKIFTDESGMGNVNLKQIMENKPDWINL